MIEAPAMTLILGLVWVQPPKPAIPADNFLNFSSNMANDGRGRINREETVNLRIAAVVTQRLPNGNLVLFGRNPGKF